MRVQTRAELAADATMQRACGTVISSLRSYSARDPCFSRQLRERALNSRRSARQTFSEEFWNFAKWKHKCLHISVIFEFLQ